MDSFSVDPLTDGCWWITLKPLNPILSPPPPEGLVKIDLTIVRTCLHIDSFGNPTRRSEAQGVPTLALQGTMSRTQYSSAMNHWLHYQSSLEADVANRFTGFVIEYMFQNYVNIHGKLQVHVGAELDHVIFEEQPEMEAVEDVKKGLCTYCINLLRDEYVFLAVAEEGLGDCSICLQKLVPAGGDKKKKKNYLFKSPCRHVFHDQLWLRNSNCVDMLFRRRSQIWMWTDTYFGYYVC